MNILIGLVGLSAAAFFSNKIYQNNITKAILKKIKNYIVGTSEVKQVIDAHNKVVKLEYEHNNKTWHLHLPYEPSQRTKGLSKRVYLKTSNETKEITQYPGIVYLLNARQMGGYEIQVCDEDTGEINTLSSEDQIDY